MHYAVQLQKIELGEGRVLFKPLNLIKGEYLEYDEVIKNYGYPVISKEVSQKIYEYRKKPNGYTKDRFDENSDYVKRYGKAYCLAKWVGLRDSNIPISNQCCNVMKKQPTHSYAKRTGRKPITAQMASESKMRTQKWLQNGCNGFDMKSPISNPMAFWTEQDVLLYIKENNIPIASVYGDVVVDYKAMGQLEGQMDLSDLGSEFGIFDVGRKLLKTTGCDRTGCMFCGYGCHLEKSPNRFERMKETHPKQYDYIMRPTEQGGLNYKEIIDWINENGNMNIKY
jgi:3'-phosphoadenosine 5'-phosphosulfate sulfotransferase (PAPS reductase)/FAD synthetase